MILSDRSIREELAAGRIVIDPLDPTSIQPSSVDLRLDRFFRVFLNHAMPVIDVKKELPDLTREIEIADGDAFILHPGEFVLGSTLERVAVPDDLVARIDGKSSLGRLGLLIHSSLPASEELLVRDADGLVLRTIGDIVKQRRPGQVVSFDPVTFHVGYHDITGWYEGPPDRIFEVRLASGRSVRVTDGHNLFTLNSAGDMCKVRTAELVPGVMVAVPRRISEPPAPRRWLAILDLIPENERRRLVIDGPTISEAYVQYSDELRDLLQEVGLAASYYRGRGRVPWPIAAQVPGLLDGLGPDDRIGRRTERHTIPIAIELDADLCWLLGMYVAEGQCRTGRLTISNARQHRLDRLESTFARLGLRVNRSREAVTCCSRLLSDVFAWLGTGGKAPTKRVPPVAFGWSNEHLRSFLEGLLDGDGSRCDGRTSVWTTSQGLVADVLLLFARLGYRGASTCKQTKDLPLWQVCSPDHEHKLVTSAPPPDRVGKLDRLVEGDVAWDRVVEVVDTHEAEAIFDIEVRPGGRHIENFLAGSGGVFVSNTAGFVDPGFDGHITLELSNVASLPITLYPGMRVGQVSFLRMTTAADVPYGQGKLGSKYQGQRGPTPSRYFENFHRDDERGE